MDLWAKHSIGCVTAHLTWLWHHSHANTWTPKILSVDMAVITQSRQSFCFLVIGAGNRNWNTSSNNTGNRKVQSSRYTEWDSRSCCPSSALVKTVIFCCVNSFMLWNIQVWCNYRGKLLTIFACRYSRSVSLANAFVSQQNYHHYPQTISASPLCYENPLKETSFCNVYVRIQTENRNLGWLFKVRELLQCSTMLAGWPIREVGCFITFFPFWVPNRINAKIINFSLVIRDYKFYKI